MLQRKRALIFLPVLFLLNTFVATAQDFPGFRSANYGGANSVFFNPANIADSRYKWDFNLLSISTMVGNDKASFNLKTIGESFGSDSLMNRFIGNNPGNTSAIINASIQGPSVMFALNKKSSVALTTRARVMFNALDIDGKLANQLISNTPDESSLPYSIQSASDMRININGWSEIGASYARVLKSDGPHFIKSGITLKYLGGVANGYVRAKNITGTIDFDNAIDEAYLNNTTGLLEIGMGGINIDELSGGNNEATIGYKKLLKFNGSGIGADIGFVYELRRNAEAHTYGDDNEERRDVNKYKLKLGLALLDIGGINYKKDMKRSGSYNVDISGTEKWYFQRELADKPIDSIKHYLDTHPEYFTPTGSNSAASYKAALPTTLQVDADYNIHKGFYVNAMGILAMNNGSKAGSANYYNSFTVTPRFESRALGIFLPVSYNSLTQLNAGAGLRLGPLFVGSGSALTALLGNSKQADFYFGLHFGSLHKNDFKKWKKKQRSAEN